MQSLPASFISLLQPSGLLFDVRTWRRVQVLLVGALLVLGQSTVSSVLQVLGLQEQRDFAQYHHVLRQAVWSSLAVNQVLLGTPDAVQCGFGSPTVPRWWVTES